MEPAGGAIRLDKWLWTARFFKTRALAAQAVAGGKVKVNGERAKSAKPVRAGDMLTIHIGPFAHVVRINALSARRGPAAEAALLYEESASSRRAREELSTRLAAERRHLPVEAGRPTKRARRQIIRLKHGSEP